jgi:hypothetical protein
MQNQHQSALTILDGLRCRPIEETGEVAAVDGVGRPGLLAGPGTRTCGNRLSGERSDERGSQRCMRNARSKVEHVVSNRILLNITLHFLFVLSKCLGMISGKPEDSDW